MALVELFSLESQQVTEFRDAHFGTAREREFVIGLTRAISRQCEKLRSMKSQCRSCCLNIRT